jgi:hypothetical protein
MTSNHLAHKDSTWSLPRRQILHKPSIPSVLMKMAMSYPNGSLVGSFVSKFRLNLMVRKVMSPLVPESREDLLSTKLSLCCDSVGGICGGNPLFPSKRFHPSIPD